MQVPRHERGRSEDNLQRFLPCFHHEGSGVRVSGLAARVFTCWATPLALEFLSIELSMKQAAKPLQVYNKSKHVSDTCFRWQGSSRLLLGKWGLLLGFSIFSGMKISPCSTFYWPPHLRLLNRPILFNSKRENHSELIWWIWVQFFVPLGDMNLRFP